MRYSLALKPNEVLSGTPLPSPFLLDGHVIEMATIARARDDLPPSILITSPGLLVFLSSLFSMYANVAANEDMP
jgi:hypothetical protein